MAAYTQSQHLLNAKGRLISLEKPLIMGILNTTPDSFYAHSRVQQDNVLQQAERMMQQGATILDIGGASSRPGAATVPEEEELQRVLPAIEAILKAFPEAVLSVDTWRTKVAREAIATGARIVNDISAGRLDDGMYAAVADLQVPYILMHMQGEPKTMQQNPEYVDVVQTVLDFFIAEVGKLRALGIKDIVLDPGFGFGKTVEQNYQLLRNLHVFQLLGLPILAGLSRKSMICRYLNVKPEDALNGTTALHMVALQQGANLLRVHDVKEAREVVGLFEMVR